MKNKIFIFTIILAAIFAFASCTGGVGGKSEESKPSQISDKTEVSDCCEEDSTKHDCCKDNKETEISAESNIPDCCGN